MRSGLTRDPAERLGERGGSIRERLIDSSRSACQKRPRVTRLRRRLGPDGSLSLTGAARVPPPLLTAV